MQVYRAVRLGTLGVGFMTGKKYAAVVIITDFGNKSSFIVCIHVAYNP